MKNSQKKKIIIFASGTKNGGGSGFENLVKTSRKGILSGEISTVISNHENGGVRQRANQLGIKFIYFPARKITNNEISGSDSNTAENYKKLTKKANLICLSGWLKLVSGLDPKKTINIHPGPLPRFGGPEMYGHHVHEAVINAYRAGEIKNSAISMHFVTDEYDRGPLFFSQTVKILPNDTAKTLAIRINEAEHKWQPLITEKVLCGEISWDGKNPKTLIGAILN
ncbi:MAG: formyltransferase family protein [bacterium]